MESNPINDGRGYVVDSSKAYYDQAIADGYANLYPNAYAHFADARGELARFLQYNPNMSHVACLDLKIKEMHILQQWGLTSGRAALYEDDIVQVNQGLKLLTQARQIGNMLMLELSKRTFNKRFSKEVNAECGRTLNYIGNLTTIGAVLVEEMPGASSPQDRKLYREADVHYRKAQQHFLKSKDRQALRINAIQAYKNAVFGCSSEEALQWRASTSFYGKRDRFSDQFTAPIFFVLLEQCRDESTHIAYIKESLCTDLITATKSREKRYGLSG